MGPHQVQVLEGGSTTGGYLEPGEPGSLLLLVSLPVLDLDEVYHDPWVNLLIGLLQQGKHAGPGEPPAACIISPQRDTLDECTGCT